MLCCWFHIMLPLGLIIQPFYLLFPRSIKKTVATPTCCHLPSPPDSQLSLNADCAFLLETLFQGYVSIRCWLLDSDFCTGLQFWLEHHVPVNTKLWRPQHCLVWTGWFCIVQKKMWSHLYNLRIIKVRVNAKFGHSVICIFWSFFFFFVQGFCFPRKRHSFQKWASMQVVLATEVHSSRRFACDVRYFYAKISYVSSEHDAPSVSITWAYFERMLCCSRNLAVFSAPLPYLIWFYERSTPSVLLWWFSSIVFSC